MALFASDVKVWRRTKASEGAIVGPTACKVEEVLVKKGMAVKKGQHMFSLDVQVPLSSSPSVTLAEEKKSEIKKLLEEQSGELVELHNAENSPMAGLDNKEDVL
ncbi:ubiquitin-conjugating enzyme/RWD-like protein, partial [Tanacetum coccineum]